MAGKCNLTFWGQHPAICLAFALLFTGCLSTSEKDVVVYTALDEEFSAPILATFKEQSGFNVRPIYDVESTKTVGLVNRMMQEREHPQCDVFWNNEILHTIRLARAGALEPYQSPQTDDWPANFRSENNLWIGFAARARVLLVNTELVPADRRPNSILDLTDAEWKERVGVARPLFGTTATHAAVLFATWGNEQAEQFWRDVKENAVVLSGNKDVALAVASGQLAFGLTDTDDAIIEVERGQPVTIVFPDQGEDELGTLFIPNTLAVVKDCPHPQAAHELIDYLLSPAIEQRLADGSSAQFPVSPRVRGKSRIQAEGVRWMEADFEAAADAWQHSAKLLDSLFGSGT